MPAVVRAEADGESYRLEKVGRAGQVEMRVAEPVANGGGLRTDDETARTLGGGELRGVDHETGRQPDGLVERDPAVADELVALSPAGHLDRHPRRADRPQPLAVTLTQRHARGPTRLVGLQSRHQAGDEVPFVGVDRE